MACMCGDTYCNSCGPLQGNDRCPICKQWDFDQEFPKWAKVKTGCATPVECNLAMIKNGYMESMTDLINAEYNDEILTKEQEKQLTTWRIMRKNFNRRPNIRLSGKSEMDAVTLKMAQCKDNMRSMYHG